MNLEIYISMVNSFVELNLKLDRFLIEKLDYKNVELYPPAKKLSSMTFGEFIYIDTLCMQYTNSKNEDVLDKILSVIFRSKRIDYVPNCIDLRIPFDCADEGNVAFFKNCDKLSKDALFYNWILIREWLTSIYPHVFSGGGSSGQGAKKEFTDWLFIRDNLAQNIADIDKVDTSQMHDVLFKMNRLIKESK